MSLACSRLASRLFAYPGSEYDKHLAELEDACSRECLTAASAVRCLREKFAQLSVDALQELYTRTFDLSPACAPYLSVHLFGESSFKRAQLMTGLAELYSQKGIDSSHELPDHLGVVLASLDRLDAEERGELLTLCLRACLPKMKTELARADNPYVFAIEAVERLVCDWISNAEVCHD